MDAKEEATSLEPDDVIGRPHENLRRPRGPWHALTTHLRNVLAEERVRRVLQDNPHLIGRWGNPWGPWEHLGLRIQSRPRGLRLYWRVLGRVLMFWRSSAN